jgi:hypothetical protein
VKWIRLWGSIITSDLSVSYSKLSGSFSPIKLIFSQCFSIFKALLHTLFQWSITTANSSLQDTDEEFEAQMINKRI